MSVSTEAMPYGGRTAWARNLAAPVRSFLSTEAGGAFVMLGAAIAALRVGELAVVAHVRVGVDDRAFDPRRDARESRPTFARGSTRA